MAIQSVPTKRKARVVSPAPTTKKVGVKSRKPQAPTKAEINKAYRVAIAEAKAQGTKPPMEPRAQFLSAILRAYAVASLTEAKLSTSKGEAEARRAHVQSVKAGSVSTDLVVFLDRVEDTDKVLGIVTDRPENTVRARLEGFCKVMGYAPNTFYAVRGAGYKAGVVNVPIYIVRK